MDSVQAFVAKAQSAQPKIRANLKQGVGAASMTIKQSVMAEAGTDRLRNVGRKGAIHDTGHTRSPRLLLAANDHSWQSTSLRPPSR